MNRTEYRQARRLFRDSGAHALRWMPKAHAEVIEAVDTPARDPLAERADTLRRMGWGLHLVKSLLIYPFI